MFAWTEQLLGRELGQFRVLNLLGAGGMGAVFRAEHTRIGKRAAIKVLHPDLSKDATVVQRFFMEARAVNEIRHENIVDISDFGETEDGLFFFVMELLDGDELRTRIEQSAPLPQAEVADIGRQIALALDAAHEVGIVHRDLKPENCFLVTRAGRANFAKLLDFGIAKLTSHFTGAHLKTRTGSIIGTPSYMSPEQANGQAVDARTDVFSLGSILYEALTGQLAFSGDSIPLILKRISFDDPVPPRSLRPELPPELEGIILRCLAKDPAARWQTMGELADELRPFATGKARALEPEGAAPSAEPVSLDSTSSESIPGTPVTTLGGTAAEIAGAPRAGFGRKLGYAIAIAIAAGAVGVTSGLMLRTEASPEADLGDERESSDSAGDRTSPRAREPVSRRKSAARSKDSRPATPLTATAGATAEPRSDAGIEAVAHTAKPARTHRKKHPAGEKHRPKKATARRGGKADKPAAGSATAKPATAAAIPKPRTSLLDDDRSVRPKTKAKPAKVELFD